MLFHGQNLLSLEHSTLRQTRRHLQMVFPDPTTSLDPKMRVRGVLSEGVKAFGLVKNEAERDAQLEAFTTQGESRRTALGSLPARVLGWATSYIGIARALSVDPELIILDEAVSALDVSIQAPILNLLRRLQSELGLSFQFITHDLSVVRYLADWVCVM